MDVTRGASPALVDAGSMKGARCKMQDEGSAMRDKER